MTYQDAIVQGMTEAEAQWGEVFTLDGNPKQYIGTFNQWQGAQQIAPGGFEQRVDGILVASKTQFTATTKPVNGQRLTLNGRRYIAVEIQEDMAAWEMVLKGVDE